jgi:hypothetical protein
MVKVVGMCQSFFKPHFKQSQKWPSRKKCYLPALFTFRILWEFIYSFTKKLFPPFRAEQLRMQFTNDAWSYHLYNDDFFLRNIQWRYIGLSVGSVDSDVFSKISDKLLFIMKPILTAQRSRPRRRRRRWLCPWRGPPCFIYVSSHGREGRTKLVLKAALSIWGVWIVV